MNKIVGLKFREYGQIYYFDSADHDPEPGQDVIVATEQGEGLGRVITVCDTLPEGADLEAGKALLRMAQEEDLHKFQENRVLEKDALIYCNNSIRSYGLEMKLVDVEFFFDRSKMIFYFTAPNRIDFRELVKDLVKHYRTRIELRQIGVRHETQMIGAVGNCGMVCCCRRFLRKFAPVTIKMAKEQNLFLNPAKISGICGRLLCCLSYEQKNYEDFHRHCPKLGKKYQTDDGQVKVLRANMFRNAITVLREGNEEVEIELSDWQDSHPRRPDANPQRPKIEGQQEGGTAQKADSAKTASSSSTETEGEGAPDTTPRKDASEQELKKKNGPVTPGALSKTQAKSADSTSRRTSRGRRKRKRKISDDGQD